ncbi:MAG: DUF2935 domain-containing protein [Chloroflexi bacterium]|nr:DUF2935 domain-containing protein [Chloroflexota bacterium]
MNRDPGLRADMDVLTRSPDATKPESSYEKVVVLPRMGDDDPANHAWADARFAADILAEHALFFALLMPEELAAKERAEALRFKDSFSELYQRIDADGPPQRSDLRSFVATVTEPIKPFIEYKARLGEAQSTGKLRSLVWPLFFDHTRHEAERWERRLKGLGTGESEFERAEVVRFWTNIMDEHARFVAHLLDPDEFELVEKAFSTATVFRRLRDDSVGGTVGALAAEPGTVIDSLAQNPEVDAVMSAVQTILDFKTQAVRDIEAGRIKSIIEPRLADHVRREALKFLNELKRAV